MFHSHPFAIFAAVVEHEGVRAAGLALGISKTTVSRSLEQLETGLGTRLLERSTRAAQLTEAGREYYAHCRRWLDEMDVVHATLLSRTSDMAGTLRISAPVVLGKCVLGGLISEFLAIHSQAKINLDLSDQATNLIEDGIDIAIRFNNAPSDSRLVSRLLASPRGRLYASSSYIAKYGQPNHPQDLLSHRNLALGPRGSLNSWTLESEGQTSRPPISPVVVTNDLHALVHCVAQGTGIGMIPDFFLQTEHIGPSLINVLPNWQSPPHETRLIYVSHKSVSPLMRAMLDHLIEHAPALLEPQAVPR